ncbi:hypothetical protein K0817_003135 [Microbacterium sp. HD4P20]|uniref:hypothetical protein n=1 Tax=Microbacterium sp. HD4P20 TaxID=2864874 RepID=UPI0020A607F0|nr:hypothetical protein [Microbacterium sp. HD4P20]MCP2635557.1 hypothetical protein [Microbacterium sp. HD4P20]
METTSTAEVPSGFAGAGPSSSVFEFHGLTLFESAGGFGSYGSGVGAGPCLTVMATEQVPSAEEFDPSSWSFNGPVYSGCAIGAFPASVEVGFDSNTPSELRDRFPSGRALQFVLDGDRLGVFLDSE